MNCFLNHLLEETNEKTTKNNQYAVLTSSKNGLYLQLDYFNKQVASKKNIGYKVIRKGEFTYRAMSDTGEFFSNMLTCTDVGIVSPAYPVFRICDEKRLYPLYLKYYFSSNIFQWKISLMSQGSTRTSIKYDKLSSIDIKLPDLKIQEKISKQLDLVERVIEKKRKELQRLDTLIKARFVEMFGDPVNNPLGWEEYHLKDCLESIDNGHSFICGNNPRKEAAPAILKLSAVTFGIYKPTENKAIIDWNDFVEDAEVHNGDLLFTRKNTPELVGMSAYVFVTPERLMMPDLIFRLNTKENCHKVFLWQLINHDLFRGQIQNMASGSAKSMSNISKEKLRLLVIALPPLELQQQFAAFVAQTDKSKFDITVTIEFPTKEVPNHDQLRLFKISFTISNLRGCRHICGANRTYRPGGVYYQLPQVNGVRD